jgi:hypothetical protein
MAKISKLELNELNKELHKLEGLHNRLSKVEEGLSIAAFQSHQLDYVHGRPTFNNLVFTWTGGTTTLSWASGWIKDKNAVSEIGNAFSQSPSYGIKSALIPAITHNIPVPAGSITGLTASSYYWLGWDSSTSKMYALKDITKLYTLNNVQVVCQVFTGTAGQTGTAGGGGSQSGSDLSGARYKLF